MCPYTWRNMNKLRVNTNGNKAWPSSDTTKKNSRETHKFYCDYLWEYGWWLLPETEMTQRTASPMLTRNELQLIKIVNLEHTAQIAHNLISLQCLFFSRQLNWSQSLLCRLFCLQVSHSSTLCFYMIGEEQVLCILPV